MFRVTNQTQSCVDDVNCGHNCTIRNCESYKSNDIGGGDTKSIVGNSRPLIITNKRHVIIRAITYKSKEQRL